MKKLLSILIIAFFLISFASAYVSDRKNWTLSPDIDGEVSSSLGSTRNDNQLKNEIGKELGLLSPFHRSYAKYNTTFLSNQTYNFSAIEGLYSEIAIADMSLWDAPDGILYKRLNNTLITPTLPVAQDLANAISGGVNLNQRNSFSTNGVYNLSIDLSGVSWDDLIKQKNPEGYFSIGWNRNTTVDDDELIWINSTEGGNAPRLIVQTSCAPQQPYFNESLAVVYSSWYLNSTCIITDETIKVWGNLTIYDKGNLIVNGSSTINFTQKGAYWKVLPGGRFSFNISSVYIT